MNILITGCSSGLGYELAKIHVNRGDNVFGISRSLVNIPLKGFLQVDFKEDNAYNKIREATFLRYNSFDRLYLNAGELGPIKPISETTSEEIFDIIKSSFLGNKQVLDELVKNNNVKRVCITSSGAAEKAYEGFSLYCMVKAMNVQLMRCYQKEHQGIVFDCLNPGPFESKMQTEIQDFDGSLFPSLGKFHRIKDELPTTEDTAQWFIRSLESPEKQDSV